MPPVHRLAGVTFALAVSGLVMHAQDQGAIAGRIADMTQQPMPGVTVTVTPERGGVAQHTTSDLNGTYRFDSVPDDTYRVDFDLLGFDIVRRNHVRVRAGTSSSVDAVLRVGRLCEHPRSAIQTTSQSLTGQVLDEADRPLPHATLELVADGRRETVYADRNGRFLLHLPTDATWSLTAFDSGFEAVTRQVSTAAAEPVMFRLRYAGTQDVSEHERLDRKAPCPENLGR